MMYFVEYASEFPSGSGAQPVMGQAAMPEAECLHVLVAEDNPINQRLVQTLLNLAGHTCVIVDDGAAAVSAIQADSFDLVLMDIRMPEMCGLAATRAIRALGGLYGDLPIIAMTANSEEDEAENCAAAGMTGYLPKPIDRPRFMALLESIARRKAASTY